MATIYLSSTFADLVEQRKAVYDALRRMRHDVVAMEHYVSADERPLEKCLKDVASCDMYIGIFAWRYGFVPTTDNPAHKSITELEYREACKLGKPCLIFLLADDVPWPLSWVDMHTREGKRGRAIQTLRKALAREKLVNYFHTSEELAALVSAAVTNALKETAQGATNAAMLLRLRYLESVYEHYKSVKLPIGPADGLSLLAIFQPLTLRNDPLAAEDLEREKRRKLLGENSVENEEPSFGVTLKTVVAENAEEALARSVQKRIVILGGPGTGKTTTLKHLVGCAAKAILDEPENVDLPLPIFISLPDLARTHLGLQGYLPHIVDELKIDISFADDLWQAISAGRAFLCLDSLDEVDPRLRGDLIERINTWTADTRNTWVVGSRFTEYKGGQFRRGQFSEWELQPMNAVLRRELAQRLLPHLHAHFVRQHHQSVTPATFAELLEKHPHAAAWGENPLLFSLAAIVFVKTGDLPSSRAALYREIVEAVLRMREHDATECELLLRTFSKLALWLHEKKDRIFTRGDLVTFLEEMQQQPWNDTIRIANRIVTSGMMEVVAHETYGFRHQTFQEYLAAVELARRLTHLDAGRRETWQYIWGKRTYSRWIEILSLLVGVLFQQRGREGKHEARRWISALIQQRETAEGDPGDLGLLLAVKSLSEVMESADEMPADLEAFAEKIALMWVAALLSAARLRLYARVRRISLLAYEVSHFPARVQQVALERLVGALKESNREVRERVIGTFRVRKELLPPLEVIKKLVDDESVAVSSAAIEMLGMCGESVPIEDLVNILDDPVEEMRQAAVRALGRQGEQAPVEALVKMLDDPSWVVRRAAIGALGGQKEQAPVEALVKMLSDKVGTVRQSAIEVLSRIGERVSIEELGRMFCDAEWPIRRAAVDALGRQGEQAPIEDIVKMLHDSSKYVRRAALRALKGRIGGIPIAEIVRMLDDEYGDVRREAVEVLGEQREQAPKEKLMSMLQDPIGSVCGATLNVLEMVGKEGIREETFDMLRGEREVMHETAVKVLMTQEQIRMDELLSILDADDWQIRRKAVDVLSTREEPVPIASLIKLLRDDIRAVRWAIIQGLRAHREWISREGLVKLLEDDDWRLRRGVVEALGALEERVSIAVFTRMLDDGHEAVRAAVVEALGKQGEQAPIEEFVRRLHDESWLVRAAAVSALGKQGERTPIEDLVGMLHDAEWMVCSMAAWMLGMQGRATPIAELVRMLRDTKWEVRQIVVEALGKQKSRAPLDALLGMLYDENWEVRQTAVSVLGAQGKRVPIEALVRMLQDDVWYVRAEAVEALGKQGKRIPIDELGEMLQDAEWRVRQATVNVLSTMEHSASLEQLEELLSDERASTRWVAVRLLEAREEEVPIETFVKMLDDEDEDVCCAAIQALSRREKQIPVEKIVQKIYTMELRVRSTALKALERAEGHAAINAIVAMVGDENNFIRETAIAILEKKAPQALSEIADEARAIVSGEAAGTLLGSIQQYFLIDVISTMGKVPSTFLDKLVPLLDWPHWFVRLRAIQALGKIRRNIPDTAIQRLLAIRLYDDLQVLRDAADDTLAEILSLETGIEDD